MTDSIFKLLAAVVALAIFQGVAYNAAFFFGTKSGWFFFLSLSDTLQVSLYAIPSAFFVTALFFHGATAFGARKTPRLRLFWLLTVFIIVSAVLVPVEERPVPHDWREWAVVIGVVVLVLCAVPLILFGMVVVVGAIFDEPNQRLVAIGAYGLFFLLLIASAAARLDRQLFEERPDVVVELAGQNTVRAKLIRTVAEGFILARGDDWIWLPRSEVKRISETSNQP